MKLNKYILPNILFCVGYILFLCSMVILDPIPLGVRLFFVAMAHVLMGFLISYKG